MDRWRRRAEPACIDITWVSCRGVRSSLPFHTPCLYACIYLEATPASSSPAGSSKGSPSRRPHRVKTTTDRAGGENPEWDAPLRLYVPDAAAASPQAAEKEANWENGGAAGLLVRFELKAEVAVLGDVLSASAAVPVSDLVADGATRRVSYQLAASDGRSRNGVISFSYAFHHHRAANDDGIVEDDRSSVSDGAEPVTPPCPATPRAITLPLPPPPSTGTMYPVIDWSLTEQVPVLYPPPVTADTVTVTGSRYYPPPPPPAKPVAVYPPPSTPDTWGCGVYPPAIREPEPSGMYPMVDLAPVTCYPPTAALYGGGCGYAAPPEWDGRCLHYS